MPIILLTTVLTLSALYAPQPLLPVIMQEFGVSRAAAAFLTTVTFLPLSVAPLFYGYVLESVAPRRMLRLAILLLAVSEFLFYWGPTFTVLVVIRFGQGLLVPAILTALMTYVSRESDKGSVQRAMAIYIAATIVGGFLGRAFSGWVASTWGWRASFFILGLSLSGIFLLLARLREAPHLSLTKPRPGLILSVLREGVFARVYVMVFCLFFVFAAVMNFLPFRLTEISPEASEFRIGLMYSGYLMGVVSSLGALRVAATVGGEVRAMLLGLAVMALALAAMATVQIPWLFADMFLFCGGMFLVHATASGFLNRRALGNQGIVNGLYVAFYYAGGAVGSLLPGYVYRGFGWGGFLLALLAVLALALAAAASCRSRTA